MCMTSLPANVNRIQREWAEEIKKKQVKQHIKKRKKLKVSAATFS